MSVHDRPGIHRNDRFRVKPGRGRALAAVGFAILAIYDRLFGWPESFDYILMLDFGAPRNPLPGLLEPTVSGSYFTLYAIARGG